MSASLGNDKALRNFYSKVVPIVPTIRAILWDNDGVLFDSERLFFALTQRVFAENMLELTAELWAAQFLGQGLHTAEIAGLLGMNPARARAMASHRDSLWYERLNCPVPLVKNAISTIQALQGQVRMAIVTGAPREHFEGLHRFESLQQYMEFSITMEECAQVKPSPAAFLLAAEMLGLQPAECLVIEDSPRGLRAALAAGMPCALLATALTDLTLCPGATFVIHDLAEIPALLQ